ncbi:uncharacterized protein LOC124896665 [Capsicum annuum]|uniref:uncharacterized protein LOC124896665 n=1 Tax=Capsicum annuum TaxID=4072 RepID=UPI001FB11400|nr:uncharacterized protein LOC124896665 [Capsicum annuum]
MARQDNEAPDAVVTGITLPYKTAKTMWDYLQRVYKQDNSARRFHLEYEIANCSQEDLSIQDYFSGFQNLWAEFTDIVYAKISTESLSVVQQVHEQSKRDQFFMKLRCEFETVCSHLMNRDPSPSLDVCLRKFCNYCKQQGHIIIECLTRPQNRKVNGFQAGTNGFTTENSSSGQVLTPEMKAMEEELLAFKENDIWDIVSCPSNVHPIRCKWVYSIKLHSDGTLDRYKAWLVVLGNKQEYGVNYEKTFAPVAKMKTVQTIIVIAAS